MKTHTVPIITNGPLCGEACPWLAKETYYAFCLLFRTDDLDTVRHYGVVQDVHRCSNCRHVTERAEALP